MEISLSVSVMLLIDRETHRNGNSCKQTDKDGHNSRCLGEPIILTFCVIVVSQVDIYWFEYYAFHICCGSSFYINHERMFLPGDVLWECQIGLVEWNSLVFGLPSQLGYSAGVFFRLCDWFSLRCLVTWVNYFSSVLRFISISSLGYIVRWFKCAVLQFSIEAIFSLSNEKRILKYGFDLTIIFLETNTSQWHTSTKMISSASWSNAHALGCIMVSETQ